MNLAARSATVGVLLASGAVFAVVASIAVGYVRRQGFDVEFMVPLVPPAATVCLVVIATRTRFSGAPGRALWGLTLACTLYLMAPTIVLMRHYRLIARDGTAYWALLILPVVWVWPVVLLGGVIIAVGTRSVLRAAGKTPASRSSR